MDVFAQAGFSIVYLVVIFICALVVRKRVKACQIEQWCPTCKASVLASTARMNTKANIILSVLTLGIWLIVWACTADLCAQGAPTCPTCGETIEASEGAEHGQPERCDDENDRRVDPEHPLGRLAAHAGLTGRVGGERRIKRCIAWEDRRTGVRESGTR